MKLDGPQSFDINVLNHHGDKSMTEKNPRLQTRARDKNSDPILSNDDTKNNPRKI